MIKLPIKSPHILQQGNVSLSFIVHKSASLIMIGSCDMQWLFQKLVSAALVRSGVTPHLQQTQASQAVRSWDVTLVEACMDDQIRQVES